jgi:hypothetical protein
LRAGSGKKHRAWSKEPATSPQDFLQSGSSKKDLTFFFEGVKIKKVFSIQQPAFSQKFFAECCFYKSGREGGANPPLPRNCKRNETHREKVNRVSVWCRCNSLNSFVFLIPDPDTDRFIRPLDSVREGVGW